MKGTPAGPERRWRRAAIDAALGLARGVFGALPWRLAQRLGAALGRLGWALSRRDRRRILDHLAIAFPELDDAARRRLGRDCFRHLGTSTGEILHVLGRDPEEASRHVRVEGWEAVAHLWRDRERPVVVLTAHCGNWELLSTANRTHGLGLRAMARRQDDPVLDRWVIALREHLGTVTVGRGEAGASREILRTIRGGGALAVLIDQDIATEGAWVPFFGRDAFTPLAAAHLGLRLGAAVVPVFAERLDDGSHLLRFEPPLELPADPVGATAVMTARIEAQIRRRPEQWVWMHKRWRRRPPVGEDRPARDPTVCHSVSHARHE